MKNSCCSYDDFITDFYLQAQLRLVPVILLSMKMATADWKKGMTGAEAFHMQWKELLNESEYVLIGGLNERPA